MSLHKIVETMNNMLRGLERDTTDLSSQWRVLRNKLDAMIASGRVMSSDELRQFSILLDSMTEEERYKAISENAGEQYAAKAKPLLQQLTVLETALSNQQS